MSWITMDTDQEKCMLVSAALTLEDFPERMYVERLLDRVDWASRHSCHI